MSFRVVGYQDGRRIVEDQGPAYARRQGFGGAAMGAYSGTTLTIGPSKTVRMAAAKRRVGPTCEYEMPFRGPCARGVGHADRHRTAADMEQQALRRRTVR